MTKNNTEGFSKELLDQLLAGRNPKTALDSGGLIGDLKKALAERMLNAEMDVHLAQSSVLANPMAALTEQYLLEEVLSVEVGRYESAIRTLP